MSDTLFMEKTKISAETTAGQIQALLSQYAVRAVMVEYDNSCRRAHAALSDAERRRFLRSL